MPSKPYDCMSANALFENAVAAAELATWTRPSTPTDRMTRLPRACSVLMSAELGVGVAAERARQARVEHEPDLARRRGRLGERHRDEVVLGGHGRQAQLHRRVGEVVPVPGQEVPGQLAGRRLGWRRRGRRRCRGGRTGRGGRGLRGRGRRLGRPARAARRRRRGRPAGRPAVDVHGERARRRGRHGQRELAACARRSASTCSW